MSDRDEFEAAICELAGGGLDTPFPRDDNGNYHAELQSMWMLWQAARRWRMIEEAPKDGTTVIVGRDMGEPWGFVKGHGYYVSTGHGLPGIPNIEGWVCRGFVDPPGELGLGNPTHFQPLPEPPNE